MSVNSDLFAPIQTIMYRFRCNHVDDIIAYSSEDKNARCPHCYSPGLLIGRTVYQDDGFAVYTPY